MTSTSLIIVVVYTAICCAPAVLGDAESTVGRCSPGHDSCSECYQTLVELLLSSSENLYSLSKAFFPPRNNSPEFVKVRYYFGDKNLEETNSSVWFWSAYTSYFLHSPHTFQFLSLFFGKPQHFNSGELDIILDEECIHADLSMMELLTQRVSYYL